MISCCDDKMQDVIIEPEHGKTSTSLEHPLKTLISLHICTVPSDAAVRVKKVSCFGNPKSTK